MKLFQDESRTHLPTISKKTKNIFLDIWTINKQRKETRQHNNDSATNQFSFKVFGQQAINNPCFDECHPIQSLLHLR
jgi:hypothetical protein